MMRMYIPRHSANLSAIPTLGFVVAMRACLTGTSQPPLYEWLIVSRWGTRGEHLSMGWTEMTAEADEAPIGLAPRQTSIATCHEPNSTWATTIFRLARSLPDLMSVAGQFLPADGVVRLTGAGHGLRIESEANSLSPAIRPAWRIQATRAAWIGEFFESRTNRSV